MSVIIALLLLCLVLAIPQAREVLGGLIALAVTLALLVVGFIVLLAFATAGGWATYYVFIEYGAADATAGWAGAAAAVAIVVALVSASWQQAR